MVAKKGAARGGAKKGPPSALEGGAGSPGKTSRVGGVPESGAMSYSVQVHDDENGLQVKYVTAESGDEAAQKVLEQHDYKGASIRGVTPASDPDPNSLGGEAMAAQMYANAENAGGVEPLGTEANREATEELAKADVEELGE